MVLLRNTFEGGTNGTVISPTNSGVASGDAFVSVSGGGIKYSTARSHEGSVSGSYFDQSLAGDLRMTLLSPTKVAVRDYLYLTNPNSGGDLEAISINTATGGGLLLRIASSGVIRAYSGSGTPGWLPDFAMPIGQWVRFELAFERGATAADDRYKAAVYLGNSPVPIGESGWIVGEISISNRATNINSVRLGRQTTATPVVGVYIDDIAVNTDVDYDGFIGATTPELATPVVTVIAKENPSEVGGADGSITVGWDPVLDAHHYESTIVPGDVTEGFFADDNNAISPKTYSNLTAGTWTVAVRAIVAP